MVFFFYYWFNSTPLHFATKYSSLPVVQLLLKAGASVAIQDKTGVLIIFFF